MLESTEANAVILDSILQTSPAATILMPLLALVAYGVARLLGACSRWFRGRVHG
jgi:hypothetical protein